MLTIIRYGVLARFVVVVTDQPIRLLFDNQF